MIWPDCDDRGITGEGLAFTQVGSALISMGRNTGGAPSNFTLPVIEPRGGRIDDRSRWRWAGRFAGFFFIAADDGDVEGDAQRQNSRPKAQQNDSFLTSLF